MTIFINAYRSFSMRYITATDIMQKLKNSGESIVLFVKDDEVAHFRKIFSEPQINIEPVLYEESLHDIRKNIFIRSLNLIRILTAGKNASTYNHTIDLRKTQYKSEFTTFKAKLVLVMIRICSWFTCNSYFMRRTLISTMRLFLSGNLYDDYFHKYKPDLLLVSSLGYGIDIAFMNSAARYGCKIISIPHSWDNSSTKGYRGCEPDRVITWNQNMTNEIEVFHDIAKTKIYTGGIAHWDVYRNDTSNFISRQDFFSKHSLSQNKKLLFYAMSGPRHFERRFDVIEGILKSIYNNNIDTQCQLLVRFHPQHLQASEEGFYIPTQYQSYINKIKNNYGDLIQFWQPKPPHLNEISSMELTDMYEMAEAIRYCDIVIQEYSTLILETTIFDKPVINISMYNWEQGLPSSTIEGFTHLRHILSYKSVRTAKTFKEFTEIANQYLEHPELDSDSRTNLFANEISMNHGYAGANIGTYVVDYLNQLKHINTPRTY